MKALFSILILCALALAPIAAPAAAVNIGGGQKIVRSGVVPTPVAVDWSNGNSVSITVGTGGHFLRITNNDAGQALTVTFADQKASLWGYTTNATLALAASQVKYAGPFIKSRWADASGLLQISYSAGTQPVSPTVEVMRLPFGEPESQTK